MLGLIVSTIAFFVAAVFINRYLDSQDMDKGRTRGVLVFVLASVISYGASEATDWAAEKLDPTPKTAAAKGIQDGDLSQLLKTVESLQNH